MLCRRTLSKTALHYIVIVTPGHFWWYLSVLLCALQWWLGCWCYKGLWDEIIKISALPAVRPSCGHSVVLATNIITVMELLCSLSELNFSSIILKYWNTLVWAVCSQQQPQCLCSVFIVLLCDSIKIGQACSATVQRQQRRNINVWSARETSTAGSGVGSGIVKGEDGSGRLWEECQSDYDRPEWAMTE